MVFQDLSGNRYGKLVAQKYVRDENGRGKWLCKCDCGNTTLVVSGNLKNGHTRSCGCLEAENRSLIKTRTVHKHEESRTRLYRIWLGMKTRCYNQNEKKKWSYYGSRGITVCEEWKDDFVPFRNWAISNGYSDDLTIDRIDPNVGYFPSNCRWVTNAEQQRNKRNNKFYTFCGRTQLIPFWAKELGVTDSTIRSRIRRGELPENVLGELFRRKEAENESA